MALDNIDGPITRTILANGLDTIPALAVTPETHSMGASLREYVTSKLHTDLLDTEITSVIIQAPYTRSLPARASANEKINKVFNWQRPTATRLNPTTIRINCPSGADYIRHYGAIFSTYFAIERRNTTVRLKLPSDAERRHPFLTSNLPELGQVDIVIVGYVEQLSNDGTWYPPLTEQDQLFAWKIIVRPDGCIIAYLGCRISFWGDIAGSLVYALQSLCKAKCILYVGKAGTLSPTYEPDRLVATGNRSFLNGRLVAWKNVLEQSTQSSAFIRQGTHVTVSSPLFESRGWVKEWQERCTWVDCEVGHMANACNEHAIDFGYLHIVSDNVAASHEYNLTNERLQEVVSRRELLFREIRSVIDHFCLTWNSTAK